MQLTFKVTNQTLSRTDSLHIVADSRNYLTAAFTFSADWAGRVKTAQFTRNRITYDMLLVNDACAVPWEVLVGPGVVSVGVFAGDRVTVNPVIFAVAPSSLKSGTLPTTATPSIYDQIVKTAVDQGIPGPVGPPGANGGTWTDADDLPFTDPNNRYTTDKVGPALTQIGDHLAGLEMEPYIEVITFYNSWENYFPDQRKARYCKDSFGFVHLAGLIRNGLLNNDVFILPAGYRPLNTVYFPCFSSLSSGGIEITSGGNIYIIYGNNNMISLDSVHFKSA